MQVYNDKQNSFEYLLIEGGHEFKYKEIQRLKFLQEKQSFYNSLIFKENIQERVNNFLEEVGEEYIAIHYRDINEQFDSLDIKHNDVVNFVQNSPIDKFLEIVDKLKSDLPIVIISNTDKFYKEFCKKYKSKTNVFTTGIVLCDRSENKEEVIRISSITTDKMHKWCADMAISENDIKGYEPKYGVFSIDKFLQNKLGSLNHAANLRSLIFDVLHHNYHMKHDNEGKLKYFYIPLCLYKDVLHLCNIIFNHNMKVFYYDNSVGESGSGWNVIENKFLVITSIGEAVNERFLTYEEYVKEFILEKVNENH